jgi:hypothetical protein
VRILVGFLLLLIAGLLQVTLMMRVTLLQGHADLVLIVLMVWLLQEGNKPDWRWGLAAGIMVGWASALPDWVLWIGYAAAAGLCQLLHQRIWQVTLLTLITATLLGTLIIHLLTIAYLFVSANPIGLVDGLNFVTLPTMLLNLILVLPVYALLGELTKVLTPTEEFA